MVGDNPDWTLPVSIRSQEISNLIVDIGAQSLGHLDIWFTGQTQDMNVNITNTTLDVNVTNSQINANITNTSFDVNVTNTTLNVSVQGVTNVEIQNAELNVKNLRDQVISVTDLEGFSSALYADSGSAASETVYTNNNNFTVYLEYFTVAVHLGAATGTTNTLDPTVIYIEFRVKDPKGTTLFTLTANGQMFLNLDPAIPIPSGGKIEVTVGNSSTYGLFIKIGGIIRKIS